MCGIAGILDRSMRRQDGRLAADAEAMARTLAHRGPDDDGVWADDAAGIALAHRRLAILDLSPGGRQPMLSTDGRWVISFNGEIYNYPELRLELEAAGRTFRGTSDTEVLCETIAAWGVDAALRRSNGMFACSIWDRRERTLHLARDRAGEKPLYYGWLGRRFVFGSELKAITSHPDFACEVDREALALYFRFKYVPAPWSIYAGIRKLLPGTVLTVGPDAAGLNEPRAYWSLHDVIDRSNDAPFSGSDQDAVDEVERMLVDSVRLRLASDVPLGALLSGGIDSSTVVSCMQEASDRPVRTFTIGYGDVGYDEAKDAARVAAHLGTDHTELIVTADDALSVVPRLPQIYDEPFADSSQIPSVLVSELTRRSVTVALSGDGGDEVFGGYNRYAWIPRITRQVRHAPLPVRRAAGRLLAGIPPELWDRSIGGPLVPRTWRPRIPAEKIAKLARAMPASSIREMYVRSVTHWPDPASLVGAREPMTTATDLASWADPMDPVAQMMRIDTLTYLPDDILAKVDRASMSVALETRIPMLDHRLVELAWRLPLEMKIRGGVTKWVLRQVLQRHVPSDLVARPKMGFGAPIGPWLRGPLRAWAEDLLSPDRLRRTGFLDEGEVRRVWAEHRSGRRDHRYLVWDVLMFEAWLEEERSGAAIPARSAG